MEELKTIKKCSSKDHINTDAILYCQICNIYMCNKCDNFHKNLFWNHNPYYLNKNNNDIFTGYCQEKNHNNKIEYFCKNHNKLCCDTCIIKIKVEGKGQHKDCDICPLGEIKEIEKNKLKANIINLQELLNNFEEKIIQLKINVEKINVEKEELKLKIQKIFTKIRNIINEREDKLLSEVDKQFNEIYYDENIINEAEKLPSKIKSSLEKGKLIDKEWDDEDKLSSVINDCINIENNIKKIENVNDCLKKSYNYNNTKIDFFPKDEKEINKNLEPIFSFGKVYNSSMILNDSKIINHNEKFVKTLINWIGADDRTKTELLFRKTVHGDSYDTFHRLCDNKGATLILIKGTEGFIIGGYTTLCWDNKSGYKSDNKTFLFSLTSNKIFTKKSSDNSICCSKDNGPHFCCLIFDSGKNMSKGSFIYDCCYYNNLNEIIPNNGSRDFDTEEVEVYGIRSN